MQIDPRDITICIEDEGLRDTPGAPLSTPIVQTSLFSYPSFETLIEALGAEHEHLVYSRGQNPTVEVVERKLAALERGERCKCFGSGMAAINAVMLGTLRAGDHVLFLNQVYGPTLQLAEHLERFGITHTRHLDLDLDTIAQAIRPETRLIWLESPGTMLMRVLDIRGVAEIAQAQGIATCIDNSWATPLLQKPLSMGIDIVLHTASKYLGGHSDVMAGAVISTEERMRELFYRAFLLSGGILTPSDAWLLLRGMRTLPVRLAEHEEAGLQVARFLAAHPRIGRVHHPALTPDQELVESQQSGHSGLFSFELVGAGFPEVRDFINALEIPRIGVSWGGVESIVISPHRGIDEEHLESAGLPRGLVRIAVGLEGADRLVADLDQALAQTRA